jgi:sulfonate transport system substrate-binding protein
MKITRGRRFSVVLITVLVGLLALAACGDDGSASSNASPTTTKATGSTTGPTASSAAPTTTVDLTGVTLRVGEIQGYNRQLLEAAGAFGDLKYNVQFSTIRGGPPMFQALAADQIDVSFQGVDPGLFSAVAAGLPVKVVSARGKDLKNPTPNRGTFWLAATPGSNITSISGLKGKTIAVSPGEASTLHYYLAKVLDDNGLTLKDVKVSFLDSASALSAALAGQVDAWSGGGPNFAPVEARGGKVLAWASEHYDNFIVATASEKALADPKKSAAIGDLIARVFMQQAWQNTQKEAYAKVLTEVTKLDLATALTGVKAELSLVPTPMDAPFIARLQAEADLSFKYGINDKKIDVAKLVDPRYNDVAAAALK